MPLCEHFIQKYSKCHRKILSWLWKTISGYIVERFPHSFQLAGGYYKNHNVLWFELKMPQQADVLGMCLWEMPHTR